ncbi:MAG: hypothetical protein IME94_07950 [Proteobacteria bacterium]|nr:hypothetical protein [Pseudomonadota bacterium]
MDKALKKCGESNGMDVSQKIIEMVAAQALAGDITSQKMIIDRLIPVIKPQLPQVEITGLPKELGLMSKCEHIIQLITDGELAVDTGKEILASFTNLLKVQEATEINNRLLALEAQAK